MCSEQSASASADAYTLTIDEKSIIRVALGNWADRGDVLNAAEALMLRDRFFGTERVVITYPTQAAPFPFAIGDRVRAKTKPEES